METRPAPKPRFPRLSSKDLDGEFDASAQGASGRLALGGLLTVVFIDALSYSMIVPLLPFIVMKAGGNAWWGGLIATIHALAAACSAPFLGRLSDKYGRRVLLILTLLGTLLGYGLLVTAHSIAALLTVRAFSGLMAGNMGIVSAGIADVTTDESRARGMSLQTATWALGFVVGPALSAILSGMHSADVVTPPSVAAALATSLSLLLVVFAFRNGPNHQHGESAVPETSEPSAQDLSLLAYLFVLALCQSGLVSMTGFWAASIHAWGAKEVSLLMLWASLGIILFQVGLVARLAHRFGELKTLAIGLLLTLSGCAALLVAPKSIVVLAVAAPLMFGGITMGQAMANTRLSRISSVGRGGRMGRATSAAALGRVVGPMIGGGLFTALGPLAIHGAVMTVTGLGAAHQLLTQWLTARREARTAAGAG